MSDQEEKVTPTKRKSDIIKRFSLRRLRSVRKSRSSAGDDSDSISVTSSTPEKIKSTPRQSLSNYAPSIESPLSKSKVLERVSRPPTPAVDIPPEQFWDYAYDRLKSKQPKLVDHYERILSLELRKIDVELAHLDIQNVIAERSAQRTPQMDRLLEASFVNLEKHSDAEGNIGTAVDIILSLRSAIARGRATAPTSAIIWTGLCISLELCVNSANEPASDGDEIAILIQRMKWYSSLPQLLEQHKPQADEQPVDLRTKLADQILDFYRILTEYTIRSTCARYHHSSLVEYLGPLKLNTWTGSLDDIDKAESSLRPALCLFDGRQDLSDLAKSGSSLSEKDQEIMTACYVGDTSTEMSPIEPSETSLSENRQEVLKAVEYTHFVNRHSGNTASALWVIFNTPKGKATPLVEIIQSLQGQLQTHFDEPCLSYFFCRGTNTTVDTATTILKGLIWMLLRQAPTLIGYLRKEFEDAGHEIFDGPSAFSHLKGVFLNMIHDNALGRVYLVIDALDECKSGLPDLLDLVVESSASPKVKWILSSKSRANLDSGLSQLSADSALLLDLNGSLESGATDETAQLESPDVSSEIAPFTESTRPHLSHIADSEQPKEQTNALISLSNIFLVLGMILLVYECRDDLLTFHVKLYDLLREFYDSIE